MPWFALIVLGIAFHLFNAIELGYEIDDVDPLDGSRMPHSLTQHIVYSKAWQWGMPVLGMALLAWLVICRPAARAPYPVIAMSLFATALLYFVLD